MGRKLTPEERARNIENLRKAREKREQLAKERAERGEVLERKPRRPRARNLSKIVREVLDDEELVDKIIANQPEFWDRLPVKNGSYIIASAMMAKAMGGDIKAADWLRKSGYGDKVTLESEEGFFAKSDFKIEIVPAKSISDGIKPEEINDQDIKQIDG